MSWILILILVDAEGSWSGYTYPTNANPQHFASQADCMDAGDEMTDGDGDNEHAICAPLSAS